MYDRVVITRDVRSWRPQGFGRRSFRDIRDPLIEPLWEGLRVLAHVTAAAVTLTGVDGEDISMDVGQVSAALQEASRAETLVLDGYLTQQATQPATGAIVPDVRVISQSEMAGQFLFGSAATRERPARGARELVLPDPEAPVAFVAIDMLLLDGSPLLDVPLLERKRLLESVLEEGALVRRSVFVRPPIDTWLLSWRALGFQSLAYKAANSRYEPGGVSDGWAIAPIPRR